MAGEPRTNRSVAAIQLWEVPSWPIAKWARAPPSGPPRHRGQRPDTRRHLDWSLVFTYSLRFDRQSALFSIQHRISMIFMSFFYIFLSLYNSDNNIGYFLCLKGGDEKKIYKKAHNIKRISHAHEIVYFSYRSLSRFR